jgi:hypothetical protein
MASEISPKLFFIASFSVLLLVVGIKVYAVIVCGLFIFRIGFSGAGQAKN